ncbi:hypothetical protein SCHPADRAFT_886696 [Schizopora paradoxa]|uniref:Uncharacterized protein n=1 Tax=Schizopora paradoxa TaxID=27342 RepID=A0A0H2S1K8_9AGAM|nr:hypothetical protein SCHPADRAFT_886696 [Schizopora paradoxa]
MSNGQAAQNPLNQPDIPFEELGGPASFENPSDTIFASLFLPALAFPNDPPDYDLESIPWQFCDRLLAVLRNPRFKPLEITFENCGEMFQRIGRRRKEKWSTVEARPNCNSHFPMVILDGVLECLKDEMISMVSRFPIERRYFRNRLGRGEGAPPVVPEWRKTLEIMMLVHSSWHAGVKRLLGYSIVSPRGPTPTTLQNPSFGGWTRELCLSYHYDMDDDDRGPLPLPLAPDKSHGYFLNILCARVPNIRLVHLHLLHFTEPGLSIIFGALSSLALLEELNLEAEDGLLPLQAPIAAISKARHPNLRVLRLYADFFRCNDLSALIRSLESLELLHSIQFLYPDSIGVESPYLTIGVCSVLWSRNPSNVGSPFVLRDLEIDYAGERLEAELNQSWDDGTVKILQSADLVRFRMIGPQRRLRVEVPVEEDWDFPNEPILLSKIAHDISPWLERCTSARTVVFQEFPGTRMKILDEIQQLSGAALANVETLAVELSYLPDPPRSDTWDCATEMEKDAARDQFSFSDAKLSGVVSGSLFPGLRVLRVTLPSHCLEYFVPRFEDVRERGELGSEDRHMLLPHCNQRCTEKSVAFHVEIPSNTLH